MPSAILPEVRVDSKASPVQRLFAFEKFRPVVYYFPFALIALIIARYLVYVNYYALPYPQFDDFSNIVNWYNALYSIDSPRDLLQLLIRPEAEHRQFFAKAIYLLTLALTGTANLRWLIISGNIFWICGAFLLAAYCYRIFEDKLQRALASLFVFFGLVHLQTYDSLAFAAGLNNLSYPVLALIALYLADRKSKCCFFFSLFFAWLSFYTIVGGFFSLLGVIVIQFLKSENLRFIAASIFTLVVSFLYFRGIGHLMASFPFLSNIDAVLTQVQYFVLFIGAPAGNISIFAGYVLGTALILFWSVAGSLVIISASRRRVGPPFLIGVAVFCIGIAAAAALTRVQMGPGQAVSSRYACISSILFVCTVLFVLYYIKARPRLVVSGAFVLLVAAFNCASYYLYTPLLEGTRSINIWNAQSFFAGKDDRSFLWPLETVRMELETAFLLGVLSYPDLKEKMQSYQTANAMPIPINANRLVSTATRGQGYLDFLSRLPHSYKFQGWAGFLGMESLGTRTLLVLRSDKHTFVIPTFRVFREDVARANPYLVWSGFVTFIDPKEIPQGRYSIGAYLIAGKRRQEVHFGIEELPGPIGTQ